MNLYARSGRGVPDPIIVTSKSGRWARPSAIASNATSAPRQTRWAPASAKRTRSGRAALPKLNGGSSSSLAGLMAGSRSCDQSAVLRRLVSRSNRTRIWMYFSSRCRPLSRMMTKRTPIPITWQNRTNEAAAAP